MVVIPAHKFTIRRGLVPAWGRSWTLTLPVRFRTDGYAAINCPTFTDAIAMMDRILRGQRP